MTAAQKRGKLTGGALTEEAIGSSHSVLTGGSHGRGAGLQQWFTPAPVADLIADVLDAERRLPVLDPTAGAGDLLKPYPEHKRFGVEIDGDHAKDDGYLTDGYYTALHGDIQRVYGIMRIADATFPRIVANPPFGLMWRNPALNGGKALNSTLACAHIILGTLDQHGVAALVCGTDRLRRELLADDAVRSAVWAIVDVDGVVFDGASLPTSIAFLCQPENRSLRERVTFTAPVEDLPALVAPLTEALRAGVERVTTSAYSGAERAFALVRNAYEQRYPKSGRPHYDIVLKGGKLKVHLGALGRLLDSYGREARLLAHVNDQPPNYFAINVRDWTVVRDLLDEEVITASPAALTAVNRVANETRLLLRPMYEVPVQMRLGFLDDLERIRCVTSDPTRGFEAGESYPLTVESQVQTDKESKLIETRDGDMVLRDFLIERRVLHITIASETASHDFCESNDDIVYLAEHFDLPDPGDIARDHPDELARVQRVLLDIQDEFGPADPHRGVLQDGKWIPVNEAGWKLKRFQLEDLSRAILKQRAVIAHDPGLGKTAQQLLAAEACYRLGYTKRIALFVAPQDLHAQWQREAMRFIGRHLELIRTPPQAARVRRHVRGGGEGFWITHYEALGLVGNCDEHLPEAVITRPHEHRFIRELQARQATLENGAEWKAQAKARYDAELAAWRRELDAIAPNDWRAINLKYSEQPREQQPMSFPGLRLLSSAACPQCLTPAGDYWDGLNCRGAVRWRDRHGREHVKGCGYTHRKVRVKSVGSTLATVFKQGVICVDEISMIRGDTARRSLAVRGLRAACRFGASATPISNFVNDCFWGLGWTLGFGTPRFPYSYDNKGKFEQDFCVIEYLMGRPEDGEANVRKRRKVLPEVTNLSMIWRLFSMSVVRRRKEDTGEPIVPKTTHIVEVPPGVAQREMHLGWLKNFAAFFTEMNPGHPLVLAGLVDKFAPAIGMLAKLEYAATLPAQDPDGDWLGIDGISNYTPKLLRALHIIEKHVLAGDRVLVGSSLMETGPLIAGMLQDRGINAVHITEKRAGRNVTKNPRARAREVTAFINGDAQVLCAGVQAMKLGHNLDCASVVVLLGLPWSHEAMKQFLDRVHRLTSTRPVTVYVLVTKGMLDVRKLALLDDKQGASDVALDGRLVEQKREQHNWSKTLQEMKDEGLPITGNEVDEALLEQRWQDSLPDLTELAPVIDLATRSRSRRSAAPVAAWGDSEAAPPMVADWDAPFGS